MYQNSERIILASGSPRRKQYMTQLGLEFETTVANIKEECLFGESPDSFVLRMAEEKARRVSENYESSWVVSGDTIVCLGERILGKPDSEDEAISTLMALAGRVHTVKTGFCVCNKAKQKQISKVVTTEVTFAPFSAELARSYVATGEPMDKAGAYGIQGRGELLVESITGSYSNVVGLPLFEFVEVLKEFGVIQLV